MSVTIAVCLKRVYDTSVRVRLEVTGRAIRAAEAAASTNSADLAALALALGLRASLPGAQVLALTVGPQEWEEPIRRALAAGADNVRRVWNPSWPSTRWSAELDGSAAHTRLVAESAAAALRDCEPALVVTGESSMDGGHGCFGAFLAHALGASYAHRAASLEPVNGSAHEGRLWRARVKLERGFSQELTLNSPVVVSVFAGVPQPPAAPLPAWMASRAARIPVQASTAPYPSTPRTQLRAPVPRVKRYIVPDPALDAEARIRAMVDQPLSGGGALLQAEEGVEAQADAVIKLLQEKGFAPRP